MGIQRNIDKRLEEQNMRKNKRIVDDEPDDMDILLERQRQLALNKNKSVFDGDTGNNTPGINTMPSVFQKHTLFDTND